MRVWEIAIKNYLIVENLPQMNITTTNGWLVSANLKHMTLAIGVFLMKIVVPRELAS